MADVTSSQSERFAVDNALKEAAWQQAKGHLRALVGIQGSYMGGEGTGTYKRYQQCKLRIETFILSIENDGLQE